MTIDKNELESIVELAASKAAKAALEEFQKTYGLSAKHWVYLNDEYNRAYQRSGIIRKIIINTIVTLALATFGFGVMMKVKEWIVLMLGNG